MKAVPPHTLPPRALARGGEGRRRSRRSGGHLPHARNIGAPHPHPPPATPLRCVGGGESAVRAWIHRLFAVLSALMLLLSLAGAAYAHAVLVETVPADGAVLPTPP